MTNSQDLSIADVSEDYKLTLRPDDDFIDIIGPYNNGERRIKIYKIVD
jgi:hypothetical protein